MILMMIKGGFEAAVAAREQLILVPRGQSAVELITRYGNTIQHARDLCSA
jgi:hypothetical protein